MADVRDEAAEGFDDDTCAVVRAVEWLEYFIEEWKYDGSGRHAVLV